MRLIDADSLVETLLNKDFLPVLVRRAIQDAPVVDAVPVVHGEWIDQYNDCYCAECSVCGDFYEATDQDTVTADSFKLFKQFYKFCPNCGAKMDGEN